MCSEREVGATPKQTEGTFENARRRAASERHQTLSAMAIADNVQMGPRSPQDLWQLTAEVGHGADTRNSLVTGARPVM
jgi:hypothetical protein